MAKRPVHWFEGMFLKPHHFQASDRYHRDRMRESEDWLHPHDWGLRTVRIDEDAIANYSLRLISCQARFKDGTTLSIPEEASVNPLELRTARGRRPRSRLTWRSRPGRRTVPMRSTRDPSTTRATSSARWNGPTRTPVPMRRPSSSATSRHG